MPFGQVLLRRRVGSLGRSSIDGVLQPTGLLSGAAAADGGHAAGEHWGGGAGWWGRRLGFSWSFCPTTATHQIRTFRVTVDVTNQDSL